MWVASRTPELWSFWGNTQKDWTQWYHRAGLALVDLVLNVGRHIGDYDNWTVNNDLRDALKSCATEDTIRLVHLKVEESRYNL